MKEKDLDKCNGCSLCAKYCPCNAINDTMAIEDNINKDRCIDCDLCHKVCPQEAGKDTTDMDGNLIRTGWDTPVIDESICSGCQICTEVCPIRCLEIKPKEGSDFRTVSVLVRPKYCIGCGFCARDCPVEAIKLVKRK